MANRISADHYVNGDGTWYTGALNTGVIADGTVLADTGQLPAGNYLVAVVGSADIDIVYDLQHRNVANDANVDFVRRRPKAGDIDLPLPNKIAIGANERVRAVLSGGVTGNIQVCLFVQEVA